jgi:hypothetical protein
MPPEAADAIKKAEQRAQVAAGYAPALQAEAR